MRLGCNFWCYNRDFRAGKLTQLQWIEKCAKKFRLDGVEILDYGFPAEELVNKMPKEAYLKKLKKLCADLQLDIYMVSAANNFGQADEKKLRAEIDYVKGWIDVGFYLGAPLVRCFSGHPDKKGDFEGGWKPFIVAMKECVKHAESKGIVMALENHGGETGLVYSSVQVIRMMKEVNSPWLKLCLDTGNFNDLYTSIEKTAHLAPVVHAKTYDIAGGVEKKLDYERIFKIMTAVKFNGFYSIEYEGENPDQDLCVGNSVSYLRSMFEKYPIK